MGQGGVVGAALTLAVTTMGAGILTLPAAFYNAGVVPAMVMLIIVALLTIVSIDYMVLCIDKIGVNSYEQINRVLLGKINEELVRWMLIVYNIGSAIGYLVVLGDLFEPLQPFISHHIPWLTSRKDTLFVFWLVVILPFSCVPDISFLRFASFLAISATSLISFLVVFRYFVPLNEMRGESSSTIIIHDTNNNNNNNNNSDNVLWFNGRRPLLALPIMMFSFDCQSLVFQIYSSLHEMHRRNMMRVSILSLIISGTIHAAVGLFGYLGHPTDVRDNVMSNFNPRTDSLFAFGYLMYAIPVNLAFVLILFPTRDAIFLMWYGYNAATEANTKTAMITTATTTTTTTTILPSSASSSSSTMLYGEPNSRIPLRDHLIVSISLSVACIAAALVVPGVAAVVALLGGVCSSTLCFTYPALYRIRLHKSGVLRCCHWREYVMMWGMLAVGVVGGLLGTIVAVMEYV
ncbi:amino acid permease-like protein [Trypanosoma theileri]|uniref:Amino acid permease-like protein n=1 Tax=Trypanosoma theileri TaxID=67003 RepID=A0A1X0P1N2_9TRYP|nr:amino acid permease-like protein [Trypanosoma theileri]ORC90603.1 amino acid permease-like protein [Trypanosoma theileri]